MPSCVVWLVFVWEADQDSVVEFFVFFAGLRVVVDGLHGFPKNVEAILSCLFPGRVRNAVRARGGVVGHPDGFAEVSFARSPVP